MSAENEQLTQVEENQEDTIKDLYLTFHIDSELYGIEIAYVKEIFEMVPITKVPQSPDYVEGIINLRGDIIGVLDVRKRFLKPPKEYDEQTCIIVIEHDTYSLLGFIVDSVREVKTIEESYIIPPPSAKLNHYNQYIRNIGHLSDGVVLLLDLDRLLAQE